MSTVVIFGPWTIGGDPETTARRSGPAAAPLYPLLADVPSRQGGLRRGSAWGSRPELANERSQVQRGGRLSATCTSSKQPRFISFLRNRATRHGSPFQFRFGPARAVATTDPALIEDARRARSETSRSGANMDRVMTEIGIRGVFNAEGETGRPQRRLSVAALSQQLTEQVGSLMADKEQNSSTPAS